MLIGYNMLMSHDGLLKLANRLFRFGVVMCIFTSTLWLVFGTPTALKQAGRDSHIYDAAAHIAQTSAINVNIDPTVKAGLDAAAAETFTPAYLQSISEQFMDGTYHWLAGSSDKPDFKIDASTAVNEFLGKVAENTVATASQLPLCGVGQVPDLTNLDLSTLKCLPPGVNPAILRDETIRRLKSSSNLLANPVLTADSLSALYKQDATTKASQPSKPFYEQLAPLRGYYTVGRALPWIFGAITLLAAIWIIRMYHNGQKAAYRVARSGMWASLPIFVATLLGHFLFRSTASSGNLTRAVNGSYQQNGIDFLRSIEGSLVHYLLFISGGIAAVSVIVMLAMYLINRNKPEFDSHNVPSVAPPKPTGPVVVTPNSNGQQATVTPLTASAMPEAEPAEPVLPEANPQGVGLSDTLSGLSGNQRDGQSANQTVDETVNQAIDENDSQTRSRLQ